MFTLCSRANGCISERGAMSESEWKGSIMQSETSKVRHIVLPFCIGNGIDIGHGGDKIRPSAIGIDLCRMYTNVGCDVSQLIGDGADLHWFRDNSLDYVYSSHLLEDFKNTAETLKEWIRVIKLYGKLILVLPEQNIYETFSYNEHHKHADFGKDYVKKCVPNYMQLIYESGIIYNYNFILVYMKGDYNVSEETEAIG